MNSKPVKVVLMVNYWPGLQTTRFLAEGADEIVRLYIDKPDAPFAAQIVDASGLPEDRIFTADAINDPAHVEKHKEIEFDFLITVYWPYLLKRDVFSQAKVGTVNFHPALLPINRGWYPHVHSILDGSPTGVTLHDIDEGADTGPIWAQKKTPLEATDTAKTIYDRLQRDIVELFKTSWPGIKSGEIKRTMQDESKAVYHAKREVDNLDCIDLDKTYKGRDLINLLRARSFGDRAFAWFEQDGKRFYVNLRLSKNSLVTEDE